MSSKKKVTSPDELDNLVYKLALYAYEYRTELDDGQRLVRQKELAKLTHAVDVVFMRERKREENQFLSVAVHFFRAVVNYKNSMTDQEREVTHQLVVDMFENKDDAEDHLYVDPDYSGIGDERDKVDEDDEKSSGNKQPMQRAKASIGRLLGLGTRGLEKRMFKARKAGVISLHTYPEDPNRHTFYQLEAVQFRAWVGSIRVGIIKKFMDEDHEDLFDLASDRLPPIKGKMPKILTTNKKDRF